MPLTGPVGGPTVTAAAELAARAEPGHVLLSGTAVALLADAGIAFETAPGGAAERVVAAT
ncbi:hypothetical protein [Nocardioides sp. TF02-7]|uniref:hypothetical protein n=1 Tax=Nocardioides sp. TF02-7 TaxID=2917724 RepID=UPI001F06D3C9|nr:hypothetical protein [Nocardioides sp. TF02-7]UMG91805.1 hypothetical protein MF408_17375 [Nocardioides sp. TF02-7]